MRSFIPDLGEYTVDAWHTLTTAQRGALLYEKTALMDPDFIVPTALLGAAGGFTLGKLTSPRAKSLKELIGEKLKQGVTSAGQSMGDPKFQAGAAVAGGGMGLVMLYKILKARAAAKAKAQAQPQLPPWMYPVKVSMEKRAGPSPLLARGGRSIGGLLGELLGRGAHAATMPIHSPIQTSKALGRGIQDVWHRGAEPALNIFRQYTGLNVLREESNLANLLKQNPDLAKAWEAVRGHLDARGIRPHRGVFSYYMNLPGALTERATEAGKLRWFLENHGDPKALAQFSHQADPSVIASAQKLLSHPLPTTKMVKDPTKGWIQQTTGSTPLSEHVKKQVSPGYITAFGVPAALMAPSLLKGDPDEIERDVSSLPFSSPFAPKPRRGMIPEAMDYTGDILGKVSPGLGNWVKEHPYASAGIGAGTLGGLGYMGYRGLRGSDE